MEAVSCLKSLVSAASQFRHSACDENLVHLLRQLDVSSVNIGKSVVHRIEKSFVVLYVWISVIQHLVGVAYNSYAYTSLKNE